MRDARGSGRKKKREETVELEERLDGKNSKHTKENAVKKWPLLQNCIRPYKLSISCKCKVFSIANSI